MKNIILLFAIMTFLTTNAQLKAIPYADENQKLEGLLAYQKSKTKTNLVFYCFLLGWGLTITQKKMPPN